MGKKALVSSLSTFLRGQKYACNELEEGINTWGFQIWVFSSLKSSSLANQAFPSWYYTENFCNPRFSLDCEGLSVSFLIVVRNWWMMIWFFRRKVFVDKDFEGFKNENTMKFRDREEEKSEKCKLSWKVSIS